MKLVILDGYTENPGDLSWDWLSDLVDELDHSFCTTIHKSQGSEFKTVIIPMSWFPPALATRNLIYTAVTRGKEKVIIAGRSDYLNAMVDNDEEGKRNSGLKSRLENMYRGII